MKIYISLILACWSIFAFSQVGIYTEEPLATLDINGELRVRNLTLSESTDDQDLVLDTNNYFRRSLLTKSKFSAYLASDLTVGEGLTKITNYDIVDNLGNNFDTQTNTFTAPISGIYSINITVTYTATEQINTNNAVFGLVDTSTNKWVMRFSVPRKYILSVGLNSAAGVSNTFIGAVVLTKGSQYFFGATNKIKLLYNPTGDTSVGNQNPAIGSFFDIQLIRPT